jgi:hypothetical protein
LLLPGLLSHGIPVLFTGSGLRIAAVFCIAIYFVFISAPGNEENMPHRRFVTKDHISFELEIFGS